MASIFPGYEYDIFISYRQKDNRHDGWVSDFVENLKGELESTFKEEISVYFDINQHDGLLETHDVDASLKDKLKCLVFIPIISRTYCDPKSFAWEHEFKTFFKQASQDQFGLKIKLPNGNVANRMIPVQIHDLYPEDKALVEKEIGGVLRAIEFIYKEPGINKPLTVDDDEKKNLNNTKYRLQINKVANALDEVIRSLIALQTAPRIKVQAEQTSTFHQGVGKSRELSGRALINQNTKKWLIILLSVALCVVGVFSAFKIIEGRRKADDNAILEKSIAVLPFVNDSPDQENAYFINGIMDEILNNLQKIKDFRVVLSRTSTQQYRGSNKPSIPRIAKELNVNYIVEGSGQKYGNKFVLRVQLIAANDEKHIWGESFKQEILETSDIINLQSQIAQAIAFELKAIITPQEKQLIEKASTTNLTAYDFYQKGKEELARYIWGGVKWNSQTKNTNSHALANARKMFTKALDDSTFALAYSGLARVYWNEGKQDSALILADKALSYDKQLFEAHILRGNYFGRKRDLDRAMEEYDKALAINPNSWEAYYEKGKLFFNIDRIKTIENYQKAASINRGSELPDIKFQIASVYLMSGFYEKTKDIALEVLKLDGDSVRYLSHVSTAEWYLGNSQKCFELRERAYKMDSTRSMILQQFVEYYFLTRQWGKALKAWEKYYSVAGSDSIILPSISGYIYLKNGYRKEAEDISNDLIKKNNNNNSIWGYEQLAVAYIIRGENVKAIENLYYWTDVDKPEKETFLLVEFLNFPWFDNLRNDPEFQKIASEMKTTFQAEHERVRKWLVERGE
jgi:TolB-like protein